MKNPLIVDSKGFYNSNAVADSQRLELKHKLEEGNHDGIIIYNSEGYKLPDYITDIDIIKKHKPYPELKFNIKLSTICNLYCR